MKIKKRMFFLLLTAITISCKKNSSNPAPTKITNIYIAGNVASSTNLTDPVYWKNGAQTTLPDNYLHSSVAAIAVNGNNVYVAGFKYAITSPSPPYSEVSVATYWKNGVPVPLTDSTTNSWATAIFINNNDVYVAGTVVLSNGYRQATCWKNGVELPLQFGSAINSSEAEGVIVSNNDVYVIGNTYILPNYGFVTYWKNGTAVTVTDQNTMAVGSAIAVSGQDVYIAGRVGVFQTSAAYWKNGVVTLLSGSDVNSLAASIQVQNNNVYVAGSAAVVTNGQLQNLVYSFVYWKNGTIVNSDWKINPLGMSNVGSMAVIDTNVYVAGTFQNHPVYWKNGQMTQLGANQGNASGIAIVQN